jgi:uncharacterized membrane protein YuzA (DUF378 family)
MADLKNPFDDTDTGTALIWIGSAGGSLAYGLSKLTEFDLVTEVLASNPELGGALFAIPGAAALAADFGLLDLGGD